MRTKKRYLAVLATAVMACSLAITGGAITASAGTVENKPAGNGLIAASGALNTTNFVIKGESGTDSAYQTSKGNMAVHLTQKTGMMLPGTGVSKTIMAKDDIKVRFQMNVYSYNTSWDAGGAAGQWRFDPVSNQKAWPTENQLCLNGRGNVILNEYARTRDENHKLTVTTYGTTEGDKKSPFDLTAQGASTPVCTMVWRGPDMQPVITANGYATIFADVTLDEDNWASVKLGVGVADEKGAIDEKTITNYVTIANWAQYDNQNDLFMPSNFQKTMDAVIDDVRITASYTEGSKTVNKTIAYYDMEDESKIVSTAEAAKDGSYLVIEDYEPVSLSELGLTATNPEEGSGIMSRAALVTDKTLPVNLELETKFALNTLTEGQKVGLAFGFEDDFELAGAHKYLYFTVQNDKVVFGGESVNAAGVATDLFTPVEVTGAKIGADASVISLKLTEKYDDLEIVVGGVQDPILIEEFDPDGFFAVMHKGTGNLTYMIRDNLTLSGFEFAENEEGATAISSNFTGNYINSNKFQLQNTVAPDSHMVKGEDTMHDITGIVAESGKVGFYGTSTNTRILTTKKYADFVMQFDYTSIPVLQRGQLVSNSYSPMFIMFGMKEGGLTVTDPSVYAIAVKEGLAYDAAMHGWAESVLVSYGMANTCGGGAKALSYMKETNTPDELAIPKYGTGGYNATKENNNVATWYELDETDSRHQVSFYARTTRFKLIAIDNYVALYSAEVNLETGALKEEYKLLMNFHAEDVSGYLGIGSDSPAWFEIDNLAITPISRTDTLAWAVSEAGGKTPAANVVADVEPASMASDPRPTPVAKPVLTISEKKVTWAAVEGAKEYSVTVKKGTATVKEEKVTATEIDLSSLTEEGDYKVTVEVIPSDTEKHTTSRETITYTVSAEQGGTTQPTDPTQPTEPTQPTDPTDPDDTPKEDEGKKGCGSSIAAGSLLGVLAVGVACVFVKRKKN